MTIARAYEVHRPGRPFVETGLIVAVADAALAAAAATAGAPVMWKRLKNKGKTRAAALLGLTAAYACDVLLRAAAWAAVARAK